MSSGVVGLDIGTSFVKVAIGEVDENNNVSIIGFAKNPSSGVKEGNIVNIDSAVECIRKTIEDAEQIAGTEVRDGIYTAIGGSAIESLNSQGDVVIDEEEKKKTMEVTESTKRRAIESAAAVKIPIGKRALQYIPQEFAVDDLPYDKNPLGTMGKKLHARIHLVTASETACENIRKCIERAGYDLPRGESQVWAKTLVASKAAINDDEMELGSILIDLGGGTTDVIVVNNGSPIYMGSIPIGGNLVTSDIAIIKGIPFAAAEEIKVNRGCCWITGNEKYEEVIIPGVGGRAPEQTNRYEVCRIIQPRMQEILAAVRSKVLEKSKITRLNGSIVLTGGGAKMPGIVELTQSIWGTSSVRIGESRDLGNLDKGYRSPEYTTAVGLVLSNKDNYVPEGRSRRLSSRDDRKEKKENVIKNFFRTIF